MHAICLLEPDSFLSGGAFFLACEDVRFLTIPSLPALFCYKSRTARGHQFHSGQDLFTVAERAETTGSLFPNELRVSSFPGRFTHYAWTA